MRITRKNGRGLAVVTTLCAILALMAAANVAAYPPMPEGEPLYLSGGATVPEDDSSTAGNAVPIPESSSDGTDWTAVLTGGAAASLAAIALLAAALVLTGTRRGSARTH